MSLKMLFIFPEMINKSVCQSLNRLARVLQQVTTGPTKQDENGCLMFYQISLFSRFASPIEVLLDFLPLYLNNIRL